MRRFQLPFLIAALTTPAWAQINETFDALADGPLVGQGAPGWSTWYSGGNDATVVSTNPHSGTKSISVTTGTDVVVQPSIDSGNWICTVWTYVPSSSSGDGFFLMLNQYGEAATDNWSVTIRFNAVDGVVESWFDMATLPIITDRWVELRIEISLDDDVYSQFYNGTALTQDLSWTGNVSGNGLTQIRCIDLYSAGVEGMQWDDLKLEQAGGCPCPFDSDGGGAIDLQDLATLLSLFGGPSSNPCIADTDGDGLIGLSELAQLLALFGSSC